MEQRNLGFSLIELLIVVSLITILTSLLLINFSEARREARDEQRKSDLVLMQSAVETYHSQNGIYPPACNGSTTGAIVWSGQKGTNYECTDGTSNFIVGLAPQFIPTLPTDPKLNGLDSGYVYAVNNSGTVYKIMALNTVETESVAQGDEFFRCGSDFNLGLDPTFPWKDQAMCQRSPTGASGNHFAPYSLPNNECGNSPFYSKTYAVSGGYSTDIRGNNNYPDKGREYDTEIIICR